MMKGPAAACGGFERRLCSYPFPASLPARLSGNPTTVGSVGFQQILPCVAVQAALAEVLVLLVLALVIEETVEALDPGVVKFAGLFNQQQIYEGHSIRLDAEPINSRALIPTKYVNGQVIQLLFWDLRDGRGGHRSLESSDHLRWGTILVSLGDVVAVDMPVENMPEPLEAPIEDSGYACFSR